VTNMIDIRNSLNNRGAKTYQFFKNSFIFQDFIIFIKSKFFKTYSKFKSSLFYYIILLYFLRVKWVISQLLCKLSLTLKISTSKDAEMITKGDILPGS